MRQFEIRRLRIGRRADNLVVVLQHPFVDGLDTCVVAPLIPIRILPAVSRLRPTMAIGGETLVLATDRMATVARSTLGPPEGSAEDMRDEIGLALDFLFKGF